MTDEPRLEGSKSNYGVWFRSPQRSAEPPPGFGVELNPAQSQRNGEDLTLADTLRIVTEHRWTVMVVTVALVAVSVVYLVLAPPVYSSNTLIQVQGKSRGVAAFEELSSPRGEAPGSEAQPEAEMEIIRSRMLLGEVVAQLHLDIEAEPRRFPVIGPALAHRARGDEPAPAVFGLSRYGWGGERISLSRLDVPETLLGEPMRLTALEGGRFRLKTPGAPALEGAVGELVMGEGASPIALRVTELVARPGTEFTVTRRRQPDVVEALQDELRVAEKAKKTGLLVLSLEGAQPKRIAETLDAISTSYLRESLERNSGEVSKALEFLESQLPALKSKADAAEAAITTFQRRKGAFNLSFEGQAAVARSVEIEKDLSILERQQAELRRKYTKSHPDMVALAEKVQKLQLRRADLNARLQKLPFAELEAARLTRDLKVATELHQQVLAKTQQLQLAKSGAVASAIVIDRALVPARPVSPKLIAVLSLAGLLGVMAGTAGAFVKRWLGRGAEDAEEVENGTGLPVYATIPHSDLQAALTRSPRRHAERALPTLSALDPADAAIENLRALRTSLQFALARSSRNIVAILGPAPDVGKSFVCVNLAHVFAGAERKVLLVDADLRRGRLHRYFELPRQPGLSDVVSGRATLDNAVRRAGQLDVLTAGSAPTNPAELLARPAFEDLLSEASRRYEMVIVDTAPILAVADPLIVGRLAGINLLVLRAWKNSVREVALAVKRLARSGVQVQGVVLNDVRVPGSREETYDRYRCQERDVLASL